MSFRFVKPRVCAQELAVVLAGFAPRFPWTQPGGRGANRAGQIYWVEAALDDEDEPVEQAAAGKTTRTIVSVQTR
jgi:hypothetical protein